MRRIFIFLTAVLFLSILVAGCGGGGGSSSSGSDPVTSPTVTSSPTPSPSPSPVVYVYRDQMRKFVQGISSYAKSQDPGFIVIPQNAQRLFTDTGYADGIVSTSYLNAIDGIGREHLFYGLNGEDTENPSGYCDNIIPLLNLGLSNGLKVLVIDYCYSADKVDDSYSKNESYSYVGFAAESLELKEIPSYPGYPYNENSNNISSLQNARNFLYLINPGNYSSKESLLNALRDTDYDVLVIDAWFTEDIQLTASDIASLKTKANGGSRLVVSYMSIGEAADYRFYWQEEWYNNPPSWLEEENPDWPGNYKVQYWNSEWQNTIYGNSNSYTQKIIDAGFDGVYLDVVDAFAYFEAK